MRTLRKIYQFFIDRPIKTGTVLNDGYEVLSVIGAGSYGLVYLCKELKTKETRVVKQLRPSKRHNKKDIEMFEKEISVLRRLNHKHIPVPYETFSHNDSLFYAMSYIDGDNLEDQIFYNKKTFNEKEALLILAQLLDLIDYLHGKDIYHRDLRIPNLLLKNKELFLIDFGLSQNPVANDQAYSSSRFAPYKQEEILEMKRQDYYDLGEILLFLLYTTYSLKNKKALPWTEELSLEKETVFLLKRLLQIKAPYSNSSGISADLQAAINAQDKD